MLTKWNCLIVAGSKLKKVNFGQLLEFYLVNYIKSNSHMMFPFTKVTTIMKNKVIIPSIFFAILIGLMVFSNLAGVNSSNSELESTTPTAVEQKVYMYLTMTGDRQGVIKGSVTTKGFEGTMEIYSYTHSIVSPRDAASGLPTGKRQHKPITITKPIDKATPLLYNSLVTNENIKDWKLQFYRISPTGTLENFYTIQLTNAAIASITDSGSAYGTTQTISFTYQKITWTWTDGGITAQDDWEAPVA